MDEDELSYLSELGLDDDEDEDGWNLDIEEEKPKADNRFFSYTTSDVMLKGRRPLFNTLFRQGVNITIKQADHSSLPVMMIIIKF